eukprot:SAG11_NODE_1256_length_5374_cov_5.627627_7_plen_108_part_00
MKPSDENVTLRMFVDHSVVEAYAQGGRAVVTQRGYPTGDAVGVAVGTASRGGDLWGQRAGAGCLGDRHDLGGQGVTFISAAGPRNGPRRLLQDIWTPKHLFSRSLDS